MHIVNDLPGLHRSPIHSHRGSTKGPDRITRGLHDPIDLGVWFFARYAAAIRPLRPPPITRASYLFARIVTLGRHPEFPPGGASVRSLLTTCPLLSASEKSRDAPADPTHVVTSD